MAHAVPLVARDRWPGVAWPATTLVVLLAVGIPVERAAFPGDTAAAAGDLAVAVALVVCGASAWSPLRTGDLTGRLLVATGVAWLAGGLADELALVHRGLLVHLLITSPGGRPHTRVEWLAVGAGYALAVVPDVARDEGTTVALAVGLAGVAVGRYVRARGLQRRARALPAAAAGALASVLIAGALAGPADEAVLWLYEAVLAAIAVALLVDLRWGGWAQAAVAGLVIDLGDTRSGSLAGVLGHAVGDPSLVVGYSLGDGRYADEHGRPVALPDADAGRAVTAVESDGVTAAVLVHDAAALRSRQLSGSVVAAVQLAIENVRLQSDIRDRVREVESSRSRLLQARDTERRRLESGLHAGVGRRLDATARALAGLADEEDELLAALPGELERIRAELRRFATGLRPPDLDAAGLADALPELAVRAPLPVEVSVDCGRLEPSLEAAVWFVCSEGLANVVKHSGAAGASIDVARSAGWVVVTVDDDGRGGADPAGRGLRGLIGRVEALGGRLEVGPRRTGGTRLRATLPVEGHG